MTLGNPPREGKVGFCYHRVMPGPSREEIDRFVLEEYEELIRAIRGKLGLNDLEAVDLAHEAITRIYDSMERFDPEKGTLGAWARGVLRNLVLQHREGRIRPLAVDPGIEQRPARAQAVGEAVSAEIADFVRSSVAALPEIYREAVRLRYLEGLELREIARRLGVPLGTVKARLSRAPRLLLDRLRIQETTARFYLDELRKKR